MRISDKAIVLQAIKHGDHKYILKLYTFQHGLVTAAVQVSRSRTARVKPSGIQAFNMLDVELVIKQSKEIARLNEASCYFSPAAVSDSLSKLSIAQFMNEVAIKTLREQGPNAHLFEFLENVIRFLNEAEEDFINLPLYFMKELCKYLGFEPQNNLTEQEPFFDCREGRFTSHEIVQPLGLDRSDSALFSEFLKINSLKTKIPYSQRQNLLESLLAYYRLHVPGFNELKSVEVLKLTVSA